jgi:glycosyltransferase involved in cell wall biosynthesis
MNIHGHSFIGWKWAWSRPLQRALAKRALVNLVGFTKYKKLFESWGAMALILERPPLFVPCDEFQLATNSNQFKVTIVSTFSKDEPLHLVLGAAKQLPDIRFYILGDTALADKALLSSAPSNVEFPGYLQGDEYWNQLNSSHTVMTLTTTRYSLVSGGIEAMTLGKPLILSRQPVLTDYFTKGAIFVDNSVESITNGIQEARENKNSLTQEVIDLAAEKRARWEMAFQELMSLLGDLPC